MKDILSYKGYSGSIEVSLVDKCLHGKILFVNDVVTYEAQTLEQLEAEFAAAVDDYLETCAELGHSPDKPFSGTFNIRIGPELHQEAAKTAFREDVKLNEYIKLAVKERLERSDKQAIHHHYHYRVEYRETIAAPQSLASELKINETITGHDAETRKTSSSCH